MSQMTHSDWLDIRNSENFFLLKYSNFLVKFQSKLRTHWDGCALRAQFTTFEYVCLLPFWSTFFLLFILGLLSFEVNQDQLLAVQVGVFLTWCCTCKLLVVQQCPGRLVGAVVAERKWPPRTSQWLLCRLSKKYGSFLLFGGWNWTKRGLKLYGARWVLEDTLWSIISVIQDVP